MRTSTPEKNPRLSGDLRKHRRARMTFSSRPAHKLPELVDPVAMPGDPFLNSVIDVRAAAARQEFDPQLLEIAGETGREQPLPLIGGHEARDLLLRPVETERFAEPGVGAGRFKLVELVARGQRRDSKHAVELVKANEALHDIVARAERDQPVTPGRRLILDLGADELGR